MSFNMAVRIDILFSFTLLIIGLNNIATAQDQCPDLSPCNCSYNGTYGLFVSCNDVPMDEIKTIFSRTPPLNIYTLYLRVRPSGDSIPADIIGQSTLEYLELLGHPDEPFPLLAVDPNAFSSSKNTLLALGVYQLDTSRLDFNFLIGFQKLVSILFGAIVNIDRSISTLPALPTLEGLWFSHAIGLNEAFQSGNIILQTNGLTVLRAADCELDEMGLAQLLDWIVPSSVDTLKRLEIEGNRIESIPKQFRSFTNLYVIYVRRNMVDLRIPSNSFYVQQQDNDIDDFVNISFNSSRIISVEPGAFQGNYSSSEVSLSYNSLTLFEEGVFKSMLQDMSPNGFLTVYENPFDCYSNPCHLAWLLRDNRQLLGPLDAFCADNTPFERLSPSLFENCP